MCSEIPRRTELDELGASGWHACGCLQLLLLLGFMRSCSVGQAFPRVDPWPRSSERCTIAMLTFPSLFCALLSLSLSFLLYSQTLFYSIFSILYIFFFVVYQFSFLFSLSLSSIVLGLFHPMRRASFSDSRAQEFAEAIKLHFKLQGDKIQAQGACAHVAHG